MIEFEPRSPESQKLSHRAGLASLYHPDSPFIGYKALQLLYDFHALRHPLTHRAWLDVEWTDQGVVERSRTESPELAMNMPFSITKKAVMIKNLFVPVMETLVQANSDDPSGRFVNYCREQLDSEYDTILAARDGIIDVREILPKTAVLRKMHEDFIVKQLSRSHSLESFIADPTG
ncbi:MAG: hypothetical protein ABI602_04045 [Candidatus Saccharibacteria bacterium]